MDFLCEEDSFLCFLIGTIHLGNPIVHMHGGSNLHHELFLIRFQLALDMRGVLH